jgi:hypothetical protein
MTICHTDEFVQSHFSDGTLIVRYINKMGTNGGGGVVDGVALRRLQAILVPGWNPNPDANLFFTNFCTNSYKQIHTIDTNSVVRIRTRCGLCTNSYIFLYKLFSTNSYNEQRARSTSREGETRAARAKPEHTSCPNQAAPGCPNVRVHPASPTLGYTRLPRPLGYTRLPRR